MSYSIANTQHQHLSLIIPCRTPTAKAHACIWHLVCGRIPAECSSCLGLSLSFSQRCMALRMLQATNAQLTPEHRATIRETVVSQLAPLRSFPKAHTFPGVMVEPYSPASSQSDRRTTDFRRSADYMQSADFPPSARPPLPSSPSAARPSVPFGTTATWSPSAQVALAAPRGSTDTALAKFTREQQIANAASSSFSRLQWQDRRQNQLPATCRLCHQHHRCLRPQHYEQREIVPLSWPMLLLQHSLHQHSSNMCSHTSIMDRCQSQRQHLHIGLRHHCMANLPQPQLRPSPSSPEPPGAALSNPRPGQGAALSSSRPGQGAGLSSPRPGQGAVLSRPRPGQGAGLSRPTAGPETALSRVIQDVETASRWLTARREPVLRP